MLPEKVKNRFKNSLFLTVARKASRERTVAKAASLSFNTIISLVPLFAVILSFGGYESIQSTVQSFLTATLLPDTQKPIVESLNEFALNSRKLGTWGLFISLAVIIVLLNNIERTFNSILYARPAKSFIVRVSTYTAALIFGILFLGTSITFTGKIPQMLKLFSHVESGITHPVFLSLLSIVIMTLAFALMFFLFPSAKMNTSAVFKGAFIGAIAWEIAKNIFSLWVRISIRNSVIYGSFFLIPVLFIWIMTGWIIILISLEIVYVLQHRESPDSRMHEISPPGERIHLSLKLIVYLCLNYKERKNPPDLRTIRRYLQLSEIDTLRLLEPFEQVNLIYRISGKEPRFLPGATPENISINEIIDCIISEDTSLEDRNYPSHTIYSELRDSIYNRFINKSLSDYIYGY